MIQDKKCSTCQIVKPIFEFYKHRSRKDGYCNECQVCCKARYNSEKRAIMHQLRRKKILANPERRKSFIIKSLLRGARARAKQKGFSFNLTYEWAQTNIGISCPVLGTEFSFSHSKRSSESASIDRIDNTKGYTQDNCIFVSYKANTIKNNATLEELVKVSDFYKNITSSRRSTSLVVSTP